MPPIKLKIRYYGDPVLSKRAKPLKTVTDEDRAVLDEMVEVMRLAGGVGLAAPQVGLSKQMLIVDVGEGVVCLINPRITKKFGSEVKEEGCLSIPGVYVGVRRAERIMVHALNEKNKKISFSATDLFSRAIQHETDHLRGRLITDYASVYQRLKLRKQLKALKARQG